MMRLILGRLLKEEEGAALVEYALLVGLIAMVCVLAITNTGLAIQALFTRIAEALTPVAAGT